MKHICFLLFLLLPFLAFSQLVADTFALPTYPFTYGTIASLSIKTVTKYQPQELLLKGIIAGDTIYGIGYDKTGTGNIIPNVNTSLEIRLRSGNPDSTIYLLFGNTGNTTYLIDTFYQGGFPNSFVFTNGSNFNFPTGTGWFPLMLDVPFVYTGGTLEIATIWNIPANSVTPLFNMGAQLNLTSSVYLSAMITNTPGQYNPLITQGLRPATIIYHSNYTPVSCSGIPYAGVVTGQTNVCENKSSTFYLNNPSFGPGINYQWQKSTLSPVSWSDISGATVLTLTCITPVNSLYRCKVTCSNSGHTSYSNSITVNTHHFQIDSINVSIANGNVVNYTPHFNDTFFYATGNIYPAGIVNLPINTDGTYIIHFNFGNICNTDSLDKTITIGCAGSPTYFDSLLMSKHTTCPGSPVTLSLIDTLPANYSSSWEYLSFSNPITISGATGTSINVNPTTTTIYRNKSTCTISGNSKYSKWDTVYVNPPPTAGTITALNTTTNYYNFSNNGMSNAQSYKWYFGDGDSSSSLAPSHHYNLAGTYNVWFVVTNAGNGCTDTAFTTVTITTGVEDVQGKLFSVSPNPFNESFVVNCPSGKGTITVTDAVGKVVVSYQLPVARGSQLKIDMKGFSNGVYLIKYQNESQTETVKIIKE